MVYFKLRTKPVPVFQASCEYEGLFRGTRAQSMAQSKVLIREPHTTHVAQASVKDGGCQIEVIDPRMASEISASRLVALCAL